jgi:hypothetical protein
MENPKFDLETAVLKGTDSFGDSIYHHEELGEFIVNPTVEPEILNELGNIISSFEVDKGEYIGKGSEAKVYRKFFNGIPVYYREITSELALPPVMLHRALKVLNQSEIEAVIPVMSTEKFSLHYNGKNYIKLTDYMAANRGMDLSEIEAEMKKINTACKHVLQNSKTAKKIGDIPFETDIYWSVEDPISGRQLKYDNYLIDPATGRLKVIDPIRRKEPGFGEKLSVWFKKK